MSSVDLSKKLLDIPKGKTSLVEAIRELELSREAFSHAENIQEKLSNQDHLIQEIKSSHEHLVPVSLLNTKLDEFSYQIDKSVKSRLDELSVSVFSQLNSKITVTDAENLINKKVSWASYNNLSQQVGLLKSRIDKHIYADFESFKTKIKLELSGKPSDKKQADLMNNEEIILLKNRLLALEQQIHQLFNDEELADEEYDSQEELDNIMDNLEKNVANNRKSHDLTEISESKSLENSLVLNPPRENEAIQSFEEKKLELKSVVFTPHEDNNKSPINRAPSKGAESRALLRRGSRESSIGSKGVGTSTALRQLTKKVATLQKDLEDRKTEIEEGKNESQNIHKLIEENEIRILENNEKFKEFNEKLEVMQASFLRAIRRSGVGKEKPMQKEKIIVKNNKSKEIEHLSKDFEDKFKRIIRIEGDSTKIANDFIAIKVFLKEKFRDMVSTLNTSSEKIVEFQKEIDAIKKSNINLEAQLSQKIGEVQVEVVKLTGPVTDLVSNQSRENFALSEEIKRNQEIIRSMLDDITNKPDYLQLNLKSIHESLCKDKSDYEKGSHSRVNSATPSLSVKHRYYKSNKHAENVSIDENWLSYMPDGKPIWLPRVPKSAGKTERKACTPDLDIRKIITLNS